MKQQTLFEESHIWNPSAHIRALTWIQPFASLMLHGKIETRTWATNYRGWVLICAGKHPYSISDLWDISGRETSIRIGEKLNTVGIGFTLGNAIAIGRIIDCFPMRPEHEQATFVKYDKNVRRFCHVYADVQEIEPFQWTGSQGWKILNDEQKSLIKVL